MKIKFNRASDNKRRLDNLLRLVRDIIESTEPFAEETVFYIIKILTDRINSGKCIDKLCESYTELYLNDDFEDFTVTNTKNMIELKKSITVYLGRDPVMMTFQDSEKIIHNLRNVGTKASEWKQNFANDNNKHCFHLFLPIGVTEVYEGRHSAYSGVVKGEGKLTYIPGDPSHLVFDISHLYSERYFDGCCYREIGSNKKIEETVFEYGCIFEIGRIIKEHNISFLNIKYSESESNV